MKKELYLLAIVPDGWIILDFYISILFRKKRINKKDYNDISFSCVVPIILLHAIRIIICDVVQMHTMIKFLIFLIVSYFSNFIFFRYVGKKWDSYIL